MSNSDVILECEGLKQYFTQEKGLMDTLFNRDPTYVKAVDDVDLQLKRGEIFGIAGESGCGKSTLGKTLVRLLDSSSGTITFDGEDISQLGSDELKQFRRQAQVIFQDPFDSLNPRVKIYDIVKEPLVIHNIGDSDTKYKLVVEALENAELQPVEEYLDRYPHELSGGQKQRVAIARALVLQPDFILADEPVSMLDVSVRASVLGLLQKLNREQNITFLFVSHDLSLLRQVSDRIGIMYLGRIVERGATEKVIQTPTHPYSKALLRAAPEPDPSQDEFVEIKGSVPDPVNLPRGCRFKDRCPEDEPICDEIDPPLLEIESGVSVACHNYYDEVDKQRFEEKFVESESEISH